MKKTTHTTETAIAGSNVLATDLVSKDEAVTKCLLIIENIIEANKWRVEKEHFVKSQEFLEAANAREHEKKHLDQIPSTDIIEKLIQIARS